MRQCTYNICVSLDFFKEFLQIDIGDIGMLIVFLLIILLSYKSFSQYNRMTSFIFFTESLKVYT
jgi:hypothetical protein